MRLLRCNSRGFTLLEILIVLVILAVIAGLAIPAYQSSVQKARGQEAMQALGAIRESMQRFAATAGAYTGATVTQGTPTTIDFNPTAVAPGVVQCFTYALGGVGAGTYTATATYTPTAACGNAGPGTITINQAGVVTRTGSMG
jgi:prepilin-type N-terminal cleavage/methylation domain-containing protein